MARSGEEAPRNLVVSLELWSAIIVYAVSTTTQKTQGCSGCSSAKAQFHVTCYAASPYLLDCKVGQSSGERQEENPLLHSERLPSLEPDELIEHYRRLIKLNRSRDSPYPAEALVRSSRHRIRHAADVTILLSAIIALL